MNNTEVQIMANVNKLWDLWNLRICILLSFFLQAFLLLSASMRQRYKSNWIHLMIWSVYLLADWIAAYGLGQTIQSPSDVYDSNSEPNKRRELFIFWGQFFLLHLGGSDSITSFSLVDTGFWLKQLAGLFLQASFTASSFILLVLAKSYKLWFPIILVFVVGLLKCLERVQSLLIASFDSFRTLLPKPNPGPDYEKAVAKFSSPSASMSGSQVVQMPADQTKMMQVDLEDSDTDLSDSQLLKKAFSSFIVFRVLFAASFVSFKVRQKSQKFFLRLNHAKAFRFIEFELIFLHDLLHTKAATTHSYRGNILRVMCFLLFLCASIWFFVIEKHGYGKFDTYLTYALLIGTIVLDIMSLIKQIFSPWSFVKAKLWMKIQIPASILKRKRWSRSVFQYDMINFNFVLDRLRKRAIYKLARQYRVEELIEKATINLGFWSAPIPEDLKEFIFNELKVKSENANDLKDAAEAFSQRGNSALLRTTATTPKSTELKWSIEEFHFMESLLLWHLATELCYQHTQQDYPISGTENGYKRICKLISDYMFYLLITQPKMLHPDFGNWAIAFQDTRAEIRRFFATHSVSQDTEVSEACEKLISVETPYRPAQVKGDESKSVLFDACILAKQLIAMEQQRWEVIARVWVELMSFAAINCPPDIHAQQPSKGGELLTHIWLLMNHLGLGTQFSEKEKEHTAIPGVNIGEDQS